MNRSQRVALSGSRTSVRLDVPERCVFRTSSRPTGAERSYGGAPERRDVHDHDPSDLAARLDRDARSEQSTLRQAGDSPAELRASDQRKRPAAHSVGELDRVDRDKLGRGRSENPSLGC